VDNQASKKRNHCFTQANGFFVRGTRRESLQVPGWRHLVEHGSANKTAELANSTYLAVQLLVFIDGFYRCFDVVL
jgi:hypothetical protein